MRQADIFGLADIQTLLLPSCLDQQFDGPDRRPEKIGGPIPLPARGRDKKVLSGKAKILLVIR